MLINTVGVVCLFIASSLAQINADCINQPESEECKFYEYPLDRANADLDNLCNAMGWMPGCSLRKYCISSGNNNGGGDKLDVCHPMSLLNEICVSDNMAGMKGCASYNTLCAKTSAVQQCKYYASSSRLPSTRLIQKYLKDICADGHMEDCAMVTNEKCNIFTGPRRGCDLLTVYGRLCRDMDTMAGCRYYNEIQCSSDSKLRQVAGVCGSSNGGGGGGHDGGDDDPFADAPVYYPPMRMYFHFGETEIILFKAWTPRSSATYWLSFVAILLLGILTDLIPIVRSFLKYRSSLNQLQNDSNKFSGESSPFISNNGDVDGEDIGNTRVSITQSAMDDLINFCLSLVETTLSYGLMLIAMTFNVGLFIAVILGLSLGSTFQNWAVRWLNRKYQGMTVLTDDNGKLTLHKSSSGSSLFTAVRSKGCGC
ncbi:hypothetical protein MP228_000700 [Amoeboaphelidium protococcarum]|nr:hypothetical protein MP228_000700 [Amoeboaphelidium protococcarum]